MKKSRSLSKIGDLKRKNYQVEHEAEEVSIPSRVELSRAKQNQAQAESSRDKTSRAEPSWDELSRAETSWAEPKQTNIELAMESFSCKLRQICRLFLGKTNSNKYIKKGKKNIGCNTAFDIRNFLPNLSRRQAQWGKIISRNFSFSNLKF